MENLMSQLECNNSVAFAVGGYPEFSLSEDEAERILAACKAAKISGPLLAKMETMANWARAKSRLSTRKAIVRMD